MQYSVEEITQYAAEEDVKFIRLACCDAAGRQKNIAIMPEELDRAFQYGIAIDGSAIPGFGGEVHSDLLLRPDPSTLCVLPWRPEHGRVVRMFCAVTQPDGTVIGADARSLLKKSQVFLVDEATAALDAQTAYQVSSSILDLEGMTRIVVTHAMDETLLSRYDCIIALKNGTIVESGSFDELIKHKGYFYSLYTVSQ